MVDHIDNSQQKNGVLNLHFKKWYVFLFKGYKNDHQIWIPKFLKSLHWLQFIWMVCEMLQLQFQHLRHRWQNEKVQRRWHEGLSTYDMTSSSSKPWKSEKLKRICINWCEVFDDDVPCLKFNQKK